MNPGMQKLQMKPRAYYQTHVSIQQVMNPDNTPAKGPDGEDVFNVDFNDRQLLMDIHEVMLDIRDLVIAVATASGAGKPSEEGRKIFLATNLNGIFKR